MCTDSQNYHYVAMSKKRLTKNHRGGSDDDSEKDGRMYKLKGKFLTLQSYYE